MPRATDVITRADIQNRLGELVKQSLSSMYESPPPLLYHYTSEAGFRSILESRTIWASAVADLNDEIEVRYPRSFLRATVERAYAVEPITHAETLFDCIRSHLRGAFDTTG